MALVFALSSEVTFSAPSLEHDKCILHCSPFILFYFESILRVYLQSLSRIQCRQKFGTTLGISPLPIHILFALIRLISSLYSSLISHHSYDTESHL